MRAWMEAPPPSTAAPSTAQGNGQSRDTAIVEKEDGKVKPTAPGADSPQPALALESIDLLLPPEIWVKILVDFRAPHILRIVALLSRTFYAATRLEPLWRALMRRDFPVEHACTYDHDVERATWFGLYREQFQSRWNNLALQVESFRDPKLGTGFRLTVTNLRSTPISMRLTFAEATGISPVLHQVILTDFSASATLAPSQVLKESYVMQMKTGGSNDGFAWGLHLTNTRTKTTHFHPVYGAPRKQFRFKLCAEYFPGTHFTRINCMGRKHSNVLVYTEQGLSVPFKPLDPPDYRAYG